ncbi:hypothetical protein ACKUB1_15690 [Methanospirillum stamsii]|uniref:hypothetical protein n=1 Tax=Methanospirillum stamsii TaxID=1277351 RepID=UPI0015E847A2|nr:hypothetical protein [Methanospirillum stamsii]
MKTDTFQPVYLDKSPLIKKPVFRYENTSLPGLIRNYIAYIDFPTSMKESSQITVQFVPEPGKANILISRMTSGFIISRPEWTGNMSTESLTSKIYMNWLENEIKDNPIGHFFYPYYLEIFLNNKSSSLYPVTLQCYYKDKNYPIIRYQGINLTKDIENYIEIIDFDTRNESDSQVFVYFHPDSGFADLISSIKITRFIMSNQEWKGDRTFLSIVTEIYLHWIADNIKQIFTSDNRLHPIYTKFIIGEEDKRPSPIYPIHLGYYYKGLNVTPIIDPLLQKM